MLATTPDYLVSDTMRDHDRVLFYRQLSVDDSECELLGIPHSASHHVVDYVVLQIGFVAAVVYITDPRDPTACAQTACDIYNRRSSVAAVVVWNLAAPSAPTVIELVRVPRGIHAALSLVVVDSGRKSVAIKLSRRGIEWIRLAARGTRHTGRGTRHTGGDVTGTRLRVYAADAADANQRKRLRRSDI